MSQRCQERTHATHQKGNASLRGKGGHLSDLPCRKLSMARHAASRSGGGSQGESKAARSLFPIRLYTSVDLAVSRQFRGSY